MASDVDDIIKTTEHPEVAIFVAHRGVVAEIAARDLAKVLLEVALAIFPERANHHRKRLSEHEIAFDTVAHWIALVIYDVHRVSKELLAAGGGLHRRQPRCSSERATGKL